MLLLANEEMQQWYIVVFPSFLFSRHALPHHLYTDDSQLYAVSASWDSVASLNGLQSCLVSVQSWMLTNKLKLNRDKTEFSLIEIERQRSKSINQSINRTSIVPIFPAKRGSVARQPNQWSTAKPRKQFRNINRPWGVTVSMGEKPNQRDVSSDISWR